MKQLGARLFVESRPPYRRLRAGGAGPEGLAPAARGVLTRADPHESAGTAAARRSPKTARLCLFRGLNAPVMTA
jgi:hypothetical protein